MKKPKGGKAVRVLAPSMVPEYMPLPPLHIMEAAILVETWFKQHGICKWALMGIQSRIQEN